MAAHLFTIDGFGPEYVWKARRFGSPWNGWATPLVDRETLAKVIASTEQDTLTFIEDIAIVSQDTRIKPDGEGNYDLGELGWCFVEAD